MNSKQMQCKTRTSSLITCLQIYFLFINNENEFCTTHFLSLVSCKVSRLKKASTLSPELWILQSTLRASLSRCLVTNHLYLHSTTHIILQMTYSHKWAIIMTINNNSSALFRYQNNEHAWSWLVYFEEKRLHIYMIHTKTKI